MKRRLRASQSSPKPSLLLPLSHCSRFFQSPYRARCRQLRSGRLLENDYNYECESVPKTVRVQVSSCLGPSRRSAYMTAFLVFWQLLLSILTYSGTGKRLDQQYAVDTAQNDIPSQSSLSKAIFAAAALALSSVFPVPLPRPIWSTTLGEVT
jgi:hypothetical protein